MYFPDDIWNIVKEYLLESEVRDILKEIVYILYLASNQLRLYLLNQIIIILLME